jgi:hypothetical protein
LPSHIRTGLAAHVDWRATLILLLLKVFMPATEFLQFSDVKRAAALAAAPIG